MTFITIMSLGGTAVLLDPGLNEDEILKLVKRTNPTALLISDECLNTFSEKLTQNRTTLNIDQDLNAYHSAKIPAQQNIDPDVAGILFTSGTTGNFKGVLITHTNILSALKGANHVAKITEDDNVMCLLPAHHIFGLVCVLLIPFVNGASITFIKQMDGEHILETMQTFKPTILVGVPRIFKFFMDKILSKIAAGGEAKSKLIHKLINLAA